MTDPTRSPALDEAYHVDPETLLRLGEGNGEKGRAKLRLLIAEQTERKPISGPVGYPASVRLAGIRDEPDILDLLLEDLEENATQVAPFSIRRIMENVECGTRGKGGFCPVIDGPQGRPVAVAVLIPTKWWFSDQVFLQEVVLYVSPEARKAHAGAELLRYEAWLSDQMTAQAGHQIFVLAGVTATQRMAPKERLYARHMNRIGSFFIYPAIEGALP